MQTAFHFVAVVSGKGEHHFIHLPNSQELHSLGRRPPLEKYSWEWLAPHTGLTGHGCDDCTSALVTEYRYVAQYLYIHAHLLPVLAALTLAYPLPRVHCSKSPWHQNPRVLHLRRLKTGGATSRSIQGAPVGYTKKPICSVGNGATNLSIYQDHLCTGRHRRHV